MLPTHSPPSAPLAAEEVEGREEGQKKGEEEEEDLIGLAIDANIIDVTTANSASVLLHGI